MVSRFIDFFISFAKLSQVMLNSKRKSCISLDGNHREVISYVPDIEGVMLIVVGNGLSVPSGSNPVSRSR
jgi:hypothetical protein